MKKIIPLIMCILVLTGCTQRMFTPILTTDFSKNAVCKIGDFSFKCKITKVEKCISMEVKSTRAKGLVMTYDGNEITISKGKISKVYERDKITSTNPAKVIFSVFDYIENNKDTIEVKRVEEHFEYIGSTPIGEFKLVQGKDNELERIEIPSLNMTIEFEK